MIDVVIDLNLHHRGPSDGPSTRLYVYNRPIDPLAAGGTVIIANWTEKYCTRKKKFFEQQREKQTDTPETRDRRLQWPQYSVYVLIIYR